MIFLNFICRPLPEASQCLVRDNDNIITTCTILLIKNKTIILFRAVIKRLGPGISLGYYKHPPPPRLPFLEPKETPNCLIPHLLVVVSQQLETLVTTLIIFIIFRSV